MEFGECGFWGIRRLMVAVIAMSGVLATSSCTTYTGITKLDGRLYVTSEALYFGLVRVHTVQRCIEDELHGLVCHDLNVRVGDVPLAEKPGTAAAGALESLRSTPDGTGQPRTVDFVGCERAPTRTEREECIRKRRRAPAQIEWPE